MQITRLKPANRTGIIEHLIFRIRTNTIVRNAASFGWLFVHGFEESASFEFGAGAAVGDPQLLLEYEIGGEIWDYADALMKTRMTMKSPDGRELEGVCRWERSRLAAGSGRRKRSNCPAVWRLTNCFDGKEWQTIGFTAENEEDNVFSQHVYRHILAEATHRYPKRNQGFVLEMHDSALPREWVDAQTQAA